MSAVLPFNAEGTVQKQGGDPIRIVAISVWPLGEARETPAGIAYDYTGEAELGAADALVSADNRQVEVEGRTFKVISAVKHAYLPHVELRLLEMQGG